MLVVLLAFLLAGGVTTAQVTIGGSVYGGGNKAAGIVTGTVNVEVKAGTVTHSVYGGGNLANVNGATQVTIDSVGKVNHSVFGGGHAANVTSANVIINNGTVGASGGTGLYGVYGGCDSMGTVSGAIAVNINGGTLDTSLLGIFGGGYGAKTITGGNVTVTIGDMNGRKKPTLNTDIYGGSALGSVNASTSNLTKVDFLNGTLHGNIYGGGLGKANVYEGEVLVANNADSGMVKGNVQVNIGAEAQHPDSCFISLVGRSIYGCNNTNGSPKGNVAVNIYKTAHTDADDTTQSNTAYAIANVFGGGRNAHYIPNNNGRATVTVYSCENTIGRVFGGGDAADAYGVGVEIYGGRFNQIFGGGNGEIVNTEANIGGGGTSTQVHGGYINQLFGGSNERGTISGPMNTSVENSGGCPEKIRDFFGGSNKVPIIGDITTTIACGAIFENVYGGSNEADITGNVTLNINGGTITNVYGGSKGATDKGADIKDDGSGTMGTVTLNLTGGTITNAFGGSNINGNIDSLITVNVNENESLDSACALHITNIYGASNLASYEPHTSTIVSPVVNIHHIKSGSAIAGNVYGGGKGAGSKDSVEMGKCISNPQVNLGDDDNPEHFVTVHGNVYGGGALSYVKGHTEVNMFNANDTAIRTVVEGNLFGAGQGYEGDLQAARITDSAVVNLFGGRVDNNVYGGGELAQVMDSAKVRILDSAIVAGNLFGAGKGSIVHADYGRAKNTLVCMTDGIVLGNLYGGGELSSVDTVTVAISGGTLGELMAANALTMKGNVFGGSLGLIDTGYTTYSNVKDSWVAVSDSALIVGSVYGGGENGRVMNNTNVAVTGGTIGRPLTLAERKTDEYVQLERLYTGNVYGGGSGASIVRYDNEVPVFYDSAGTVYGNTNVTVSDSAVVRHNVYGGGNMASVGTFTMNKTTGIATSYTAGTGLATVTISGNALIGPKKEDLLNADSVTQNNNFKYLGANEGSVFGSSRGLSGGLLKHFAFADSTVVTISGNAQVVGDVFGGGENGHVQKGTNVIISGGVIGGIPLHDTLHTVSGGEYDGVTVHLASGESEIYEDEYSAGARVQRGNVFGGGKGTDSILWQHSFKYCYTAGRVYGNAHVTVGDSAQIYNRVYGGGAVASVGTFKNTDPTNSHAVTGIDSVGGKPTGTTYVTINGGRIGTNGRNNGDVFGGGKGLAGGANSLQKGGTQVVDEAYVGNTYVTVNGGTIASSVYGGSANGHVQGDAHVTINDTNSTTPTVIGTPGLGGWHGNVYGGGGGTNRYPIAANKTKHSITSGRVFGNTEVTVNGGRILHNVYGGGAVASIGTYNLDDPSNLWVSGGTAEVKVLGGTIGTDGHENGMVYGSGRGEVDYSFFDSLAYATNTVVTIGTNGGDFTTPIIKGSVYGSGENGHVFKKATVNVYSGTIGCDSAEYAAMDSIQKADNFPFRGNVYGAGCGTDTTPEGKYNSLAGVVQGNTEVNIHGGYISRNVYGAGAMASVGSITDTIGHRDVATTFALSWPMALTYAEGTGTAVVNITGGHIGTVKAPEGTSGDVYGSARGEAGDRYEFANLANVHTAKVTVDFSPSPTNVIVGSVYGSGENGHVYDSTLVTLNNGLINGSLFGGGKGTDKYTDHLKNPSTDALYDAEVYDITAGKVYGNTHVVMNGGRVAKNVYGGGNLASVGIGNYKVYGEATGTISSADSLLAENSGHCYVNILGGVIGPDSIINGTIYNGDYAVTTGHVYGAGKGIVFPTAKKVGFDYDRDYYVAYVNKTFVIIGDSNNRSCQYTSSDPHVTGIVFGGGENGHTRFDTYIQTNRGQIGVRPLDATGKLTSDVGHWNNRGNIFGAGRGEDKLPNGKYCQSAGSVTRNTRIDVLGARIYRNVQGGGAMASVGPIKGRTGDSSTCVINVRLPLATDTLGGPSNTNNAFGGYIGGGSRGIPSPDGTRNDSLATCHNSQINIYRGRVKNTLYGGGENGQMLGNTEINVYGGYIRSAIYGGGKGSWKASADEAGMPGTYNNDTLSGYIAGNTTVNLLGGNVPFTYGGCRRASVGGNTTINIGKENADGTYSGEVAFISNKNKVYGGNQYAGTPKGDITVNVYSTAHGDDPAHNKYPAGVTDSASLARNDSIQTYAIGVVYGGSYNSNYLPKPGHSATVHVYGCENTIEELYGGGAAADVGDSNINANTNLIIDGGRFKKVFGGGDGTIDRYLGEQIPANIYGVATTQIHSGLITEFFGGSNQMGNVKTISTQIDHDTTRCAEVIGNLYSGSNESDIFGDGELIIACGAGEFNEVYGGSNNAQIHGNVTLTIRGGTIGSVFGGSKGRLDDPATDTNESFAANIDGNVTLNLEGGTIGEAFGGSNINGAIHGIITVNVLDTCQDCPLKVENVYGAGNITPYTPDSVIVNGEKVPPASPLVNIKHTATPTTFTGSVYGGGFGTGAVVTANPVVTIGDTSHVHTALVGTNVFGGGSFAEVKGNTTVLIQNPNTRVSGAIYGGGALADVRSTNVTLNSGTVGGNIYGGGLGRNDIAAKVNGDVQVTINGGKAANIYGANNINGAPTGAVKVDIYGTDLPASGYALGNVFGGGNNAVYDSIPQVTIHNCNNKIEYVYGGGNAASVKGTNVVVYGGDTIGNIYGGCYGADVTQYGTQVNIYGGSLGSVFGGNNASGDITGAIRVNVNKQTEPGEGKPSCEMHISRVYGGGNHADSKAGLINIGCTGGEGEGIDTVYGGANQADIAGKIELNISGGRIGNLFGGNNKSGNISDSIIINVNWDNSCSDNYLGNIYGAGNLAQYNPTYDTIYSPVVNLINGTVSGNVYGGGLGMATTAISSAETNMGRVSSNPVVNVGDTAATYTGKVRVKGNVLGGGALAKVSGNTRVNMFKGTVDGSVFGAGEGCDTNMILALVMKNSTVNMIDGRVKGSVYGGGDLASVGYYIYDSSNATAATALPDSCKKGTGHTAVFISGGIVGPDTLMMPTFKGHVFGGGKGRVADPQANPRITSLGYSNTTEVVISDSAFIKGSVYGGSESGHVFDSTYVKIQGGQIGSGFNYANNTNYGPYTKWDTASLAECHHWPFETSNLAYDPYADKYNSKGGALNATDGHTYYGNVFGGGSGVFAYQPVNSTHTGVLDTAVWSRTAGAVYGNTRVEVTGGHILTSLYGGNEMTDVGTYNASNTCIKGGTASVIMTGGTLGVPRTLAEIAAHPVTCYLFGAGKGDPRIFFNTRTNIDSAYIRVGAVKGQVAPRIYGSVFGGGEDGHVLRHVSLNIDSGAYIGTEGLSYVDGNIFGAGRGFSGEALTAGTVGGNVEVNITGGTMLGNVYGGGRLASVGTLFTNANDPNYGKMQEGDDHGYVTVNISGGTVIGTEAVFGTTRPSHLNTGNVYGGSMGRLTLADGKINPIWPNLAKVKHTEINISDSAVIRASVYGGSELGTVTGNTKINITSPKVKIGTIKRDASDNVLYRFGSVLGGGYGTDVTDSININNKRVPAGLISGRVYGNTEVNIDEGAIANNVFGGGKRAYVGDSLVAGSGNTTVNIGNASQSRNSVIIGNCVYGANDEAGSPLGNTNVHIYHTGHSVTPVFKVGNDTILRGNSYPTVKGLAEPYDVYDYADVAVIIANNLAADFVDTGRFAIKAVYGGGNYATHTPVADTGTTLVHIHNCESNTIYQVFGGGNAAGTKNNSVIVDGGHIHHLFGGGNGKESPADATGIATTRVHGGLIDTVFGGSNFNGTCAADLRIDHTSPCEELIASIFGGGNYSPGHGGSLTIDCGTGYASVVYGGSNLASNDGDIELNINGGTFDSVFAGSRGSESIAADIDGNVTLNLHGGTIVNAFGGNNYNGNITGVITVNVEDTSSNCALALHNLYGGSNLATYHPMDTTVISPVVNIRHIPNGITGFVFGAGKGEQSTFIDGICQRDNVDKGRAYSNPQVNIGDANTSHRVRIDRNVYGGGELAEVYGSTEVNVTGDTTHTLLLGNLFGAGKGYVGDSIAANVSINATVNVFDGKVNGNVYGGGELSSVGIFKPVPGVGYTIDEATGLATVNIMGGHIGADDLGHATSATANGNVYGAGLGRAGVDTTSYGTFRFTYYNYVRNTDVTIGGNAIVRGSVFGGSENGHVWNNTNVKIQGGEIGTDLTAAEKQEDNDGAGSIIYTGNVYGGGRGIDESDVHKHTHSLTAGRVFGNTRVHVSGGIIHHDVFGGGSLASVGDTIHDVSGTTAHDIMGNVISGQYHLDTLGSADSTRTYQVGDPVTGTGLAEVIVSGGRIGRTGHNEGSVFGSGRGLAGDASHSEYYHMAYVHNTKVTIKADTIKKVNSTVDSLYIEPDIRGSVFGGGANGHVTQNAYVCMSAGVVGGKTADEYTPAELATMTVDTTINGVGYYPGNYYMDTLTDHWGRIPDGHHTFLGNVYAGGRGVDHSATTHFLSRYAGRVFGNATVEISGGLIYHSVYGGGSMASVGHYAGGASMDAMTCDPGTGKAVVKVSGGRIGTSGRNNGRVFGASRGMSGNEYNYLSFVNTTDVTVSGNAVVRGCVFGGGEDGHVLDSTLVKIQGGTIGSGKRTDLPWGNEYIGNVYGGGRGVDLDTNHRPSNTAGWVRNATHVIVSGGHIHHNVYGGGSLASVGNDGTVGYKNTTGREGRAWVEVTGGRIGIYAAPVKNSDGSYSPNPNSLYGSVFGAGRGRPGVGIAYGNDWTRYTYVSNTNVVINYNTIDNNNYITGNVFGGGNNGHVNNSTSVTVHSGRIGSDGNKGFGSLEGNVFGGGRGEERYEAYRRNASGKYCDANGTAVTFNDVIAKDTLIYLYSKTLNASQENYKTLGIAVDSLVSVTAGMVYGNTNVSINGDSAAAVRILHHVYGGGANASVGNYYIADADYAAAHKLLEGEIYLLTPGTGTATVNITGGTLGTAGLNNGMVFGACRGDIGAPGSVYDSIAYVNESHITIGTLGKDTVFSNPLIHGSVYGGGENGHIVGDSYVTIHSGSIGHHADMYERAKVLDDLSNPTAAQTAELNRILDSLAYCGNVYGGGCGTDKYIDTADGNKEKYNPYAGIIYGNTYVNMDGGYVERNIYGGGAMAGLGRRDTTLVYHNNPDSNFALSWPVDIDCRPGKGVATINITGGARVGYSGKDNGDIFGASRGEAGDRYEMAHLANVSYTHVIINIDSSATGYYNTNPKDDHRTPLVAGSVYGGAENGHVLNNTDVQMKSGIVGHALYGGGKGKGTYQTHLHKIGTPITSPADSTATIYSLTAGRVYRNTHITMTGGKVVRNIYGGGNMASVGKGNYGGGPGDYREAGYGERWTSESLALRDTLANSGHTYVTITGGTVGILDPQKPKNSLKEDLPLGNVFGGCRGESAPNVSPSLSPRYAYAPAFFSGYVNHTHVTIGAENSAVGPRLYGSVYGGGQDGHVRCETSVIINGGEIGVPYGDTMAARALVGITDLDNIHWVARGNVYGAGSGIGKYTRNDVESYSTSSGSVTDSTKVCIKGGIIHRNVYGGGSLASIGPLVLPGNPDPDTNYTKTVVIVSGGQIGEADDFEQGYGGSVYGASRGMSEMTPNDYATVWWSRVNVENQADIAGNVYGGGEIGHVKRDTRVNLLGGHVGGSLYGAGRGLSGNEYKDYCNVDSTFVTLAGGQVDVDVYGGAQDGHVKGNTHVTVIGGTVGVGNTSQLNGNVFGGGQGSGQEYYEDDGEGGTDTLFNIYATCGRVGGNTTVNMTSGHLHGSIFGGGRLALTGVGDTGAFVDAQHGNATITVSGTTATIKAVDGVTDSVVYSTIIGTDNIDSLLRCDWSVGDIMGSGKGDINYYNDILAGRVTNTTVTISGDPIVRGSVFGGGEMAGIGWWGTDGVIYDGTGVATVTINGGTIGSAREFTYDKPVHDALSQRVGNENPGEWTMYNDDGTILHSCTGNVFGGSQGDIDTECPHWVSMGRSRTATVTINGGSILGGVYGGSEQGIVTGNTAVTINSGDIGIIVNPGTANEYYYGDVYAAGYGCDDPDEWDDNTPNDSTAGSAGMGIGWNPGLLAGRTFGNASVDVLGGTIYGSVYGGGSFASVGDDKPGYTVNGNTLVNIGSPTEGNATIYGDVFGANNYRGTPYGNTEVNIYHTAHDSTNSYPLIDSLKAFVAPATQLTGEDLAAQTQAGAQGYALRAVYGGGNKASHEPIDTVDGTTRVRVYYCDENTVHTVYGGGNAANTRNNSVIIDGGRIYRVFGGGNGYSETGNHDNPDAPHYNPGADVLGTASTHVNAGLIDQVYGGSNQMGNIAHVDLSVTHDSADCEEVINESFGGGNEAPGGGGEVVIKCGTYLENFYAGANAARLGSADNPVKLKVDIQGGNIGNFFGGCKGTEDEPADIYGDITVNYHGGRIVNLFGGSDVNGNISGTITVNVDVYPDFCKCADGLQLDRIYGGGRNAAYTPYDPFRGSPTVNIKNNRYRWADDRANGQYTAADSAWVDIIGVYGGGLGATATCTSYPRVIIGGFPDTTAVENNQTIVAKRFARIQGNVYGGGEAAPVVGNTLVMVRNASVARNATDSANTGMVFGGGLGATAKVTGETYVGIFGQSNIENNVYGGGNAGIVTGSTELQLAYQQQIFPPEIIAYVDNSCDKVKGSFKCTTPGVRFSYTKDGSEPPVPATASSLYIDSTDDFCFGWNDTIQCIAYLWDTVHNKVDSSMIPSFIAFDKATMPTITIKEGTGSNPDTVTLGGSIGARIRYTLDGSEPTHASTQYGIVGENDGIPFTISHNQVVKAMAEMRGCYNSAVSALTAEAPTITLTGNHVRIEGPAGSKLTYTYGSADVATPIAPMAGSIRPTSYSGTDSDSNVVEFDLPSATSDYTIKAVAYKSGYLPSLISATVYRTH